MPQLGTLRHWNDARGFGFITPAEGGPAVFVHISAFTQDGSRPVMGEKLSYQLVRGLSGQPQAERVERLALGAAPAPWIKAPRPAPPRWPWLAVALLLTGLLAALVYQRH